MDYIFIKDLVVEAKHGVLDFEKEKPQKFLFSAKLYLDSQNAALDDDLAKTVDYAAVCECLTTFCVENSFNLVETLADRVAELLLNSFDNLHAVKLSVQKPNAPIGLPFSTVGVSIQRKWHTAFLSLGSSLGDRENNLKGAIKALEKKCKITKVSTIIETEPYGNVAKNKFLNMAVEIKVPFNEYRLLSVVQQIEKDAKRERKVKWEDRVLDIDILLFDCKRVNSQALTIPHPDMKNRVFVLSPLAEIAPHLVDPLTGERYIDLLKELKNE